MDVLNQIQNSPWVLALALIIGNIGLGFILDDLSDKQKEFLNNCFMRKVYLFALLYCGTKNVMVSLIAVLVYSLVIHWM